MECPNCKKELKIRDRVFRNLETYKPNGVALTVSDCCGFGFIVESQITYKITEYKGYKKEDDWGEKLPTHQ